MKTNLQTARNDMSHLKIFRNQTFYHSPLRCLLAAVMAVFYVNNIDAAQLIWDAGNTNNGSAIDPGSGSWNIDTTANFNWNDGVGNVSWTQTSTTAGLNGAIFNGPDAPDGTYHVTVDDGQIAFTNLIINANGYVFDDGGDLANALYQPTTAFVQIAGGKTVTISNNISGPGNGQCIWVVGTGATPATLNMFGRPGGANGLCFSSTNGSTVNLGGAGPFSFTAGMNINANVLMTNGVYNFTVGGINVGRNVGPYAGITPATAGKLIMDGPNTVINFGTTSANSGMNIGQGTGQGTVVMQNGATLNAGINAAGNVTGGFGTLAATYRGELDIYGGSFNIGNENTPSANNLLQVMIGGCVPGCSFVMNQTNGSFTSYAGIVLGGTSGSFSGGYVAITNSGGFFNIGPGNGNGIRLATLHPATNYITFSGGTVTTYGGSWSTALPITLDTVNGNITFQCADTASATPYNITLNGALSGPGGLNKTGGGILALDATNNYAGSTVVSNGTVVVPTLPLSSSGPVVLDGSAGSPIVSMQYGGSAHYWSIGDLTYASGSPVMDFNFGSYAPSSTVAPVQSSGDVVFAVTPGITVEGSAIAVGTYPLIHYSGVVSGTVPTSASLSGGSAYSGYITNIIASKTIALVVTGSPINPISWRGGSGIWDINTTANWASNGVPSTYGDGDLVEFDDSATGPLINVALNTTVTPFSIAMDSQTNNFVISGNGTIAGGATSLSVLGSGSLTLTGTNTYAGGTTVNSGQLNINFGGDNSGANSAIGTGALTLNAGASLDNTSGGSVDLMPSISQLWNGDWTFIGSANLSTGFGTVTLGNNLVNLTVVSNTLDVQGSIVEGAFGDKLIKSGDGALTLQTDNSFSGGFELDSGVLNIGSAGCFGYSSVVINNGAIDNVSGADLTLNMFPPATITWGGSFTFLGTGNLDLGYVPITPSGALTVNVVSNILTTEGSILSGNYLITKTGAGTWVVGGSQPDNALTVVVNDGELDLARTGLPPAIGLGGTGANGASAGLTVQSNALAKITGVTGDQISNGKYIPVVLNSGGAFDMNGQSETVDLVTMDGGILRNGLAGSSSTLTIQQTGPVTATDHPTNAITLNAGGGQFDVPSADATLNIAAIINGNGNLVKTGLGMVTLLNSNNYTGNIAVNDGTLSLSFPDITNTATVTIATNSETGANAVLNLNFADTNTVAALVVGGATKPAGLYNASTDPLYITGSGSLLVVPVATVNPLPGPIQFNASGNTLSLSWPTNSGWILQSQTNSLSVGLIVNSNSWFDVPGSAGVTSTNITINQANQATFFRLRHP